MDLGFTTVLPIGPFPTPTATVQFGGDGAPTPTATVAFSAGAPTPTNDSGFGFTRALEGGAHDAWGGQRKGAEAAAAHARSATVAISERVCAHGRSTLRLLLVCSPRCRGGATIWQL